MKAVEVSVDGNLTCVAGVGDDGVLSVSICCCSKPERESPFQFHVGGLDSRTDEHIHWKVPELRVGSEVSVRLVEAAIVDSPDDERMRGEVLSRYEYRHLLYKCGHHLTSDDRHQLIRELIVDLESQDIVQRISAMPKNHSKDTLKTILIGALVLVTGWIVLQVGVATGFIEVFNVVAKPLE